MSNEDYAVMARKRGKEDYFKIVKYDGSSTFSEEKAIEVQGLLEQRAYEAIIVEHKSPFDVLDLGTMVFREYAQRQMNSSQK